MTISAECSVEDCIRPFKAKGFCLRHYHRWVRYGDPSAGNPGKDATLWERFETTGWTVTDRGCWEWRGSRYPRGYGQFAAHGRNGYAHRFAYEHFHAVAPGESKVCHSCDNPPCVNPSHLFLGSTQDNSDDMRRKLREASGERAGQCKLSDRQVDEIRRRYAVGDVRQAVLAEEFGTTQSNVSLIVRHVNRRRRTTPLELNHG